MSKEDEPSYFAGLATEGVCVVDLSRAPVLAELLARGEDLPSPESLTWADVLSMEGTPEDIARLEREIGRIEWQRAVWSAWLAAVRTPGQRGGDGG